MKRREFIALIGGAAATKWPPAARAHQPAMPAIGWLFLGSEVAAQQVVEAFRSGLADLGYTEGRNIRLLYRYADGHADRLSALAVELVALGVTLIVAGGGAAIQAAHDSAPGLPIVSWAGPDPVMMGWVQSLARPGGMITGLFFIGVFGKRLEMLKEVRPQATKFCFLLNAANPANPQFRSAAQMMQPAQWA
jgi:putative ABC transport system substrate-binding protein